MNSGRPAATRRKMDVQLVSLGYAACCSLVVASSAIRVHAVLKSIDGVASVSQKREINDEVPGRPIRHSAHVPLTSVPSRYQNVIRYPRIEHFGLVPLRRNRPEKLHHLRLAQIV